MHGSALFSGPTRTRGGCGGWRHEPSGSVKAFQGQPFLGDPLEPAGHGNRWAARSRSRWPMRRHGYAPARREAGHHWSRIAGGTDPARHHGQHYRVWHFLDHMGLSFKKSLRASEQDRPDVARRRRQWKARQGKISAARLVFVDETWAKTNMTR